MSAVRGRIEVGMHGPGGAQRIDVRDQVAAHAIGVDQVRDGRFLVRIAAGQRCRGSAMAMQTPRGSACSLTGRYDMPEFVEDRLVELVRAVQQRVEAAEEPAGFRALDDAVVVGAGDHHHLADAHLSAHLRRRARVLGGIIHGAGGDDGALARPSAGEPSRTCRPCPGFVSEIVVPWKSAGISLACAGARHDIVERRQVLR